MSQRQFRSIFLSDVHLGTPDCKAEYLLDFLRSTRSQYLYLVGDIIDLEALAQRSWWHPLHSAILGELLHKAESGTRVIYIPGNHDAPLRGLAGQKIGAADVCLNAIHVGADGRRYRVSHGDEFDPDGIGKAWLVRIGDLALKGVCKLNRALNALRRRFDLPYLPLSIITKSRIGQALAYIQRFEASVAQAARDYGVDGHICGHIHYGSIRRIDGTLYLNDGDWVEHCTALTEDEHGTMELLHWSEHRTALARTSAEQLSPSPIAALAFAAFSPDTHATDALRPAA